MRTNFQDKANTVNAIIKRYPVSILLNEHSVKRMSSLHNLEQSKYTHYLCSKKLQKFFLTLSKRTLLFLARPYISQTRFQAPWLLKLAYVVHFERTHNHQRVHAHQELLV